MLSGSYQSPNNKSSSRSVLLSTKGISVTGSIKRKVEMGVGEEEGQEDIVVLIEFLKMVGEGVGRGSHGGS